MIAIGCTMLKIGKWLFESVPRIPISAVGRLPLRSDACSADVQSDSGAALWMRFAICSSTTAVRPELQGREMCRIEALQYPPGATKGCHACPPQSNDLSPNRQGPIHNTTKQGSEFSPPSPSFAPINAPIWIHIVSTFSRLCQLIQFSNYSYLRHWYACSMKDRQTISLSVCPSFWFRFSPTTWTFNFIADFPRYYSFVKVIIDFASDCERKVKHKILSK